MLIILDLVIALVLIKWIFKTFKNLKSALYYLFVPNIVSVINRDYENDFSYTHKLLLILIILFVILMTEIKLFY